MYDYSTAGDTQVSCNLRLILGQPCFCGPVHSSSAAVDNVIRSVGNEIPAKTIMGVREIFNRRVGVNTSVTYRAGIREFANLPVELDIRSSTGVSDETSMHSKT